MIRATVLRDNGAHAMVRVSIGPDADHLAATGFLTVRVSELAGFLDDLAGGAVEIRDERPSS